MKKRISKVSEIMEFKASSTQTVRSDETIGNLSRRLQRQRIGAMVVSDDGETIAGIISERDIAYALALYRNDLTEMPVGALMTKKVITCTPEDKVIEIVRLMSEHHIRHVPVVSGKKVIGIIGMRDIIEQRLEELEHNMHMMGKLVSAG